MGTELPTSIPCLRDFAGDADRFLDVFETAFLPNTDGVRKLERWLEADFEKEVVMQMKKTFSRGDKLRMLGVGTGDGKLDGIILEKFLRHFDDVQYSVVEPDRAMVDQFKREVANKETLQRVHFDWYNTTIEEYWENIKDSPKFDFISMIHTAYYLEDMGKIMDLLLASSTDGGLFLLAHKSAENKTVEFARRLPWMSNASHLSPGARIRDAARRANQRHVRVIPFPAEIDITSVFDVGSDVGPKLMDFLTQSAYFCQTAPADVVKATVEVLRSLTTESDDGKRLSIRNDFEVVLI